jgi:hypothetical protein
MHARLGEVEFFWHDATEAFGYCIEVITADPQNLHEPVSA